LPTKGHSLEVTVSSGTVHCFKGLLKRDELVAMVVKLAASYVPKHTVLALTNGEPDDFEVDEWFEALDFVLM
jgi:hypothetical protein